MPPAENGRSGKPTINYLDRTIIDYRDHSHPDECARIIATTAVFHSPWLFL